MSGYRPEGLTTGLDTDGETNAESPAAPSPATPRAWGWREWGRWGWRQLTSMRVALMLLMLLAVAALPGAFFPQRNQDPAGVAQYYADHPGLAPVMDRWGLFDVYASPWFAAIYLLLFISLVGCIIPRAWDHARSLRRPPPAAPRRFARFDVRAAFATPLSLSDAERAATRGLRGYRVRRETSGGVVTLSAERGYLRETGNIAFHLALLGLLLAVGYGSLVHYRGQVIVVEGDTFANSRLEYDSFDSGAWFDPGSLDPFRMTLNEFDADFDERGVARDFTAYVSVTEPGGQAEEATIKVNHPLRVGGASVYLMGNGYAPTVTVYDAAGNRAFSGAVPFIPGEQSTYDSRGVIKVPDTTDGVQIGLNGVFLPTGVVAEDGTAFSLSPEPNDPVLVLEVWAGDLGLDEGIPQNVYQLDTEGLTQSMTTDAEGEQVPVRVVVHPGETVDLPDGLGTITFESLPRFIGVDLRYDPTLGWVLAFSLLALAGLAASLFLPRRRVFVRIGEDTDSPVGARTVVTAAALARGDDPQLERELRRVIEPMQVAPTEGAPNREGADE